MMSSPVDESDAQGRRAVDKRGSSDLATRSKIAGVVVLVALGVVALGIVVFTTIWLALLIGLFVLFVGLPAAYFSFRRRSTSDSPSSRA
jgi:uncharacterized membrane protein HdeD (DUF308 family)